VVVDMGGRMRAQGLRERCVVGEPFGRDKTN